MRNPSIKILQYLSSLASLLMLWSLLALWIPQYLLPPPLLVARTLWVERSYFIQAYGYTLTNTLCGATLGISLGIAVGFVVAYSKLLRWIAEPYLVIFQCFPRESLFPLLIVWLGFGYETKIINAGLLSFFPIAMMTLNGLQDVRGEYLILIRGWGASRFQEYIYCRLPALVPTLFSSIKIAFPLALIGAVLGEFMGSNRGLGYIIISSGSEFRVDRLFGSIVILALTGSAMLAGITLIQTLLFAQYNQE